MDPKNKILTDEMRKEYLSLMNMHNENRIDYNNRKWETIKFFQTVYMALMGSIVVVIVAIGDKKGVDLEKNPLRGILFSLLFLSATAMYFAIRNLRRESRNLFREEGQIFKIALFLGLDCCLPLGKRWLPQDDNLFMEKWRNYKYGCPNISGHLDYEGWVKARMKGHSFQGYFERFFLIQLLISFAIGLIFWALPHLDALKHCCFLNSHIESFSI